MAKYSVKKTVEEKTKKIFINLLDSYHGKNLAQFFARVEPGVSTKFVQERKTNEDENIEKMYQDFCSEKFLENGWKISGTVENHRTYQQPKYIDKIIQSNDRNQLLDHLKKMDAIIYDITYNEEQIDEAVWACQELERHHNSLRQPIRFILLSTVMTWAKTEKHQDGIPFAEDDFRSRRPHPNYVNRYDAERTVLKIGLNNKIKLLTYVVASGLTYGMEEGVFHYLFKSAWHNAQMLDVIGTGNNNLPTIHIMDLAGILQNLADAEFKTRYVVAVDASRDRLTDITYKISQTLGSGKIQTIDQHDAMLNKDITQTDYDMILINTIFESSFVYEKLNVNWHCEEGLVHNIQIVVDEYRKQRNLLPIKIFIFGPPASGKTTVAKQLAREYKLHHLQIKHVISQTINELEELVKMNDRNDSYEDDDEVLQIRVETARNLLDKIQESRRYSTDGRLDDETIKELYRFKLMSSTCQNQGFILDGYPKTYDQALNLFRKFNDDDDEEENKVEDVKLSVNESITPDFIFSLQSSYEYLRQRILYLPERSVYGTHNNEQDFRRRYKIYNDQFPDSLPEKYFEDVGRPIEILYVDKDRSVNHRYLVEKMMKTIGKPHNYGTCNNEQDELLRYEELKVQQKLERERLEELERDQQEAIDKQTKLLKEMLKIPDEVKHEQYNILNTQSMPLRNYLMEHVMPTLTKALIDCCQVRPDDPIDFLAEYLFKNNPEK